MTGRLRFGAADQAWSFADPTSPELEEAINRLRYRARPYTEEREDLSLALGVLADLRSLVYMPTGMAVAKLRAIIRAVRGRR